MAKLLDISPTDFEHLNVEGQYQLKRIVYTKKFQKEILDIRSAIRITDFPVVELKRLQGEPLPREGVSHQKLTGEIDRLCTALELPFAQWYPFLYNLVAYNKITWLVATNYVHKQVRHPTKKRLENLTAMYERNNPDIALHELLLYKSNTLEVSTEKGDIVMRIAPDALAGEVKNVLKEIEDTRSYFRDAQYGKKRTDYLDKANEALYLHTEEKLTDIQIAQTFNEGDRREESLASVRQMIARAKEMGY